MPFGKYREAKGDAETMEAGQASKMYDFVKNQKTSTASSKTILGGRSKMVGQIYFDGVAEVDGEIDGEVVSEGVLIVGESANLKAKITGQDVTILGSVEGDIVVSKRLSLKHSAHVVGNIIAPVLSIEEGVIFQGACRMDRSSDQNNTDE